MHMYPLGDIGLAFIGAFCLLVAYKVPSRLDATERGSPGFEVTKLFVVAGLLFLILSFLDVTFKGGLWQR